jgi:hypothetical protein
MGFWGNLPMAVSALFAATTAAALDHSRQGGNTMPPRYFGIGALFGVLALQSHTAHALALWECSEVNHYVGFQSVASFTEYSLVASTSAWL